MRSLALTAPKDEKKACKKEIKEGEIVRLSRYDWEVDIRRRIPTVENNGSIRPGTTFKSTFPCVRTDSLNFEVISFITLGLKLEAKKYFLENTDKEKYVIIKDKLLDIVEELKLDIEVDDHPVVTIGRCMDILYKKNLDLYSSIEISDHDDIEIANIYVFQVNTEYCIIPIHIIYPLENEFPELVELYINFLGKISNQMGVLELGYDKHGWIEWASEQLDERLLNAEDDEEERALEHAIWLYGPEGYVNGYEKRISEAHQFTELFEKFKPVHEIEKMLYEWFKKWIPVFDSVYSLHEFGYYKYDEDSYPPVTINDCCRFVWAFNDAYYETFDQQMQTSSQEGGVEYPSIAVEFPRAYHYKPVNEEPFVKMICDLMREGRDIYYDIIEKHKDVINRNTNK